MTTDRTLHADLPGLHETQERQEAENVLATPLGSEMGVAARTWPDGLWSVRCAAAPSHEPGNQITGVHPDRLEAVDPILDWFDAAHCSARVRLPGPHLDVDRGQALAGRGFVPHELEAWMAGSLDDVRLEAPDHDIRPVDGPSTLQAFLHAFFEGWGVPEAKRPMARAALGPEVAPSGWYRAVAFIDDEPAGEAILALFGEWAYLAEAATVPKFRRRGVQRALIAHRAEVARAAGARRLFGGVRYGDPSWANMRAYGLSEAFMTMTFLRPSPETVSI